MRDESGNGPGSPCSCGQPFDAEKAYRALSRDVATLVTLITEMSAARAHGLGGGRAVGPDLAVESVARALRIVGGVETTRFPACCCLGNDQRWFCSGTLIAPRVVLTAAHCGAEITRVFLAGGDILRLDDGEVVPVEAVLRHPEYDPNSHRNDISLVVLAREPAVEFVQLAASAEVTAAQRCTLVGFGYNDPNRPIGFGIKREVDVAITAMQRDGADDLARRAATLGFFADSEFVAGRKALGLDSCNGDSGGPAFIDTAAGFKIAGLTSRAAREAARPCGDGGIYVRADFYERWIRSSLAARGLVLPEA